MSDILVPLPEEVLNLLQEDDRKELQSLAQAIQNLDTEAPLPENKKPESTLNDPWLLTQVFCLKAIDIFLDMQEEKAQDDPERVVLSTWFHQVRAFLKAMDNQHNSK